jgi:hypothetical protein
VNQINDRKPVLGDHAASAVELPLGVGTAVTLAGELELYRLPRQAVLIGDRS